MKRKIIKRNKKKYVKRDSFTLSMHRQFIIRKEKYYEFPVVDCAFIEYNFTSTNMMIFSLVRKSRFHFRNHHDSHYFISNRDKMRHLKIDRGENMYKYFVDVWFTI